MKTTAESTSEAQRKVKILADLLWNESCTAYEWRRARDCLHGAVMVLDEGAAKEDAKRLYAKARERLIDAMREDAA